MELRKQFFLTTVILFATYEIIAVHSNKREISTILYVVGYYLIKLEIK